MKIIITELGELRIKRGDTFKAACCPFSTHNTPCGDWCALFGEKVSFNEIKLCHNSVYGEIEDKRK